MSDLTPDQTIVQARPLDFWPIQEKGQAALPACLDLLYGSGHLRLTYAQMEDWVLVTPELIRIAVPEVVNTDLFRSGMAAGGALRKALVDLRCAAISDRGILTACGEVTKELQRLCEQPDCRGADHVDYAFDDPVMQPYDRWWYGIERNGPDTIEGRPQVLAFPIAHVSRARERNPNLAIGELSDLPAGLSPVMAKIGVPRHSADYAAVRAEWIEIAVGSLAANIEEAVKGWPVLPGEPFQNVVLIDHDMFFITLDTIDGVTVASPTASKQALEEFTVELHRVGHVHMAQGLMMLHRATLS